jgi:penicillin-binding protein 1A
MSSILFSSYDNAPKKSGSPETSAPKRRFLARHAFLAAALLAAACGGLTGLLFNYQFQASDEFKQVAALADYQPSVVTQVFADDEKTVIGEFALERRVPLAYDEIPLRMRQAIMAIEDSRFEKHWGVDPMGLLRAAYKNALAGRTVEGGSTLTQQLTKLLFLSPEKTLTRKAKEAMLALQIERHYSKQQIMELYCNQIFLGGGSYGVEAGAQYYFGKSVKDCSIEECAMLAAIPKAPSGYSPVLNPKEAKKRRNLVISNMVEEGFITPSEGEAAKNSDIKLNLSLRDVNNSGPYAYFVEEIRRELEDQFGTRVAHTGGLQVMTTLDADAQVRAVNAVRSGLHQYERRHGVRWRGDLPNVKSEGVKDLSRYKHPEWALNFFEGMYVHGLVTGVSTRGANVSFGRYHALVTAKDTSIASEPPDQILKEGDVAIFRIKKMTPPPGAASKPEADPAKAKDAAKDPKKEKRKPVAPPVSEDPFELQVELEQQPQIAGALLCLDAATGEVRAMVGGYDFSVSKFNNATQGERQTGSCFKPFIYTAALENGWQLDDTVADSPFQSGNWSPHNYDGGYMGSIPLRTALAQSRNIPAVRLLASVGIKRGAEMVKRFGISNPMAPYLPSALGATEVPLLEMVSAYSTFPNHGERAKPHYIRRILDRSGRTLYDYERDETQQFSKVVSPYVAGEMVELMRGVVEKGTATKIRSVTEGDLNKRPFAGKTGTVNDFTDAWFIGYSPSVVCGSWIGYQGEKRSLGRGETGSQAALPMWIGFMGHYMQGRPIEEFPKAAEPDADIKQMQASRARELQREIETNVAGLTQDTAGDSAKRAMRDGDGGDGEPKPKKKRDLTLMEESLGKIAEDDAQAAKRARKKGSETPPQKKPKSIEEQD